LRSCAAPVTPDPRLGQQPRRTPADERAVAIVGLGGQAQRALCGAAQRGDGGAILDRLGGMAAQARAASQQVVGRQSAELVAQAFGRACDQRLGGG